MITDIAAINRDMNDFFIMDSLMVCSIFREMTIPETPGALMNGGGKSSLFTQAESKA